MNEAGSHPPERKPRGQKPSPEKRRAIIAAAASLFAERGIESSTTREIAARAETTERTLFKHFTNKEGLIQAVIEAISIDMMRQAAYARVWDDRPFTRLEFLAWHRSFILDRINASKASPENYLILFKELFRDPDFRARYSAQWIERVFKRMAEHIAKMQAAQEIQSNQTPEALTAAFFSLNISYLVSRFVLAPAMPWNEIRDAETIVSLVQDLFMPQSPRNII